MADSAKLPQRWFSVPDLTGLAPLRLISLTGEALGCSGDVVISDPCELLLIQWVWFSGQEEKHFFLSPEQRWIWLCARDRRELPHFYGCRASNPFFAFSGDGDDRLQIHWPDFPDVSIPHLHPQPVLVPMRPFNEYSTTHFGHFVVELLPLLLVAEMLSLPLLLSRPLPSWAHDLLDGVGMSQLLNHCLPVPPTTPASADLGRAEVQLHRLQGRLLGLQPSLAADLLRSLSAPLPRLQIGSSEERQQVGVLSRQRLARHQRWSNEDALYDGPTTHNYHQFIPEALGVASLSQSLLDRNITVVVAAIGSAAYQLFLNRQVMCRVVLLCGGFNPAAPSQWFSTFEPFRHRFWLLYRYTRAATDWNAPFSHKPQHVDRAVSMTARAQLGSCSDPIFLGEHIWLLPSEASLGALPSFGIDFS